MMDLEFTGYITTICKVDPAVNALRKSIEELKRLAYNNGTTGVHYMPSDEDVKVTEVSYMSKQYSLAPLVKLHKDFMKRTETQPFLIKSMSALRNYDPQFEAQCTEAYAYLYPNSCK